MEGGESEAPTEDDSTDEDERQHAVARLDQLFENQPYIRMPQGFFAGLHVALNQLQRSRGLPDEAMNMIGMASGLANADRFWVVYDQGWHQIASLQEPGTAHHWTMRGWVIPYAPAGSGEVVQHQPIFMVRDVMEPGLGIRPPLRESGPMSSDESSSD